jgi:hypothetical protein
MTDASPASCLRPKPTEQQPTGSSENSFGAEPFQLSSNLLPIYFAYTPIKTINKIDTGECPTFGF